MIMFLKFMTQVQGAAVIHFDESSHGPLLFRLGNICNFTAVVGSFDSLRDHYQV